MVEAIIASGIICYQTMKGSWNFIVLTLNICKSITIVTSLFYFLHKAGKTSRYRVPRVRPSTPDRNVNMTWSQTQGRPNCLRQISVTYGRNDISRGKLSSIVLSNIGMKEGGEAHADFGATKPPTARWYILCYLCLQNPAHT